MNGLIEYSTQPMNDTYVIGTLAKYTCSIGYALVGDGNRTCSAFDQEDIVGDWTLTAPSCQCKKLLRAIFSIWFTTVLYLESFSSNSVSSSGS